MDHIRTVIPPYLRPFVLLSYPVPPPRRLLSFSSPTETLYGQGPEDLCFAAFAAIAFTVLREISLRYILSTIARLWLGSGHEGLKDERARRRARRRMRHVITRFAEQGWSFLYCTVFWTIGMVILFRIPNATSPEQLWGTYPTTHLPALTKFYYLAQFGWWFHQIYVINSEKQRKDHWQMFGHHVLTIVLISTSYVASFTRVGTLIHVLMDFCDIFLPLAKMLRYLGLLTLCDITFVVFLISWFVSRQICLFLVIRSLYLDGPRFIPFRWAPSEGRFFTQSTYYGFIAALCVLYVLATMWFYMACMVAIRVLRGMGAEDSRSDDEDEGESPLEDVPEVSSTAGHITRSGELTPSDGEVRKRR